MKTVIVQEVYNSNSIKILCDQVSHYYQNEKYTKYMGKCKHWQSCQPSVKIVWDR